MKHSVVMFCVCVLVQPVSGQRTVSWPAQDRPVTAREQQLYRIGSLEGAAWEVLGDALEVEFDARGRLHVLDRGGAVVHAYDAQGRHRWSAGRKGGGPGEFALPTRIAVLPAGEVIVVDPGNRRMERFDDTGRYLGSVPFPGGLLPARIHAAGSDALYFLTASSRIQEDQDSVPLLRVALDGSSAIVAQVARRGPRLMRTANGLRRELPPTFSPQVRTAVAGARLAVIDDVHYSVLLAGSGPVIRVQRPLSPRAVTDADRDAAREQLRSRIQDAAAAVIIGGFRALEPEEVEDQIRRMTFADAIPVVLDMRGAPDGALWVARSGPVTPGPGPIDIMSADGAYVGTLPARRLPAALGPGGLAAWLEPDENGVPTIRVSRITVRSP